MKGRFSRETSNAKKIAVVIFIILFDIVAFATSYLIVMPVFNLPAAMAKFFNFNFVVSTILPVIFMGVFGGYKFKNLKNFLRLIYLSAIALSLSFGVNLLLDILLFEYRYFRFLFYYFISSFVSIISLRLIYLLCYRVLLKIKHKNEDSEPALIIGAGFTGRMVYNELYNYESKYVPICFVDDDEEKIGTYILGLKVLGPTVLIPEIVKKYGVKAIVFAIPSCSEENKKRILKYCAETDCDISVLPSGNELMRQKPMLSQVTKLDLDKLIDAHDVERDLSKIKKCLLNKSVLVTGAGGSIGSELCRQIIKCDIKHLVLLDINENSIIEINQELLFSGVDADKVSIEVASVRDFDKLDELFKKYSFDIVFHAAAHKHVPLMEMSPEEAVKNNCIATNNLAKLCIKHNVAKMIFISTDKAATPDNVMAATKRTSEILLKSYNRTSVCDFKNVRFGNVLGSSGSVIQLFLKQINNGGPITVTHPEVLRYFMTISECVHLILKTATLTSKNTTFILDTGKPVKILSLAENLINMCGLEPYKDIDIKFSGLRMGETLKEKSFAVEQFMKTKEEKIYKVKTQNIDFDEFENKYNKLEKAAIKNSSNDVLKLLDEILK